MNWEILPPGERDKNIATITAGMRNGDEETQKRIVDRYDVFEKMKPKALIHGQQELLASGREGKDFFRVVHGKGWKKQVRDIIDQLR